jgi:hypothetical protein
LSAHLAEATRRSVELRSTRSRQKAELRGKPLRELVPALVHPTPELASYTIRQLFTGQRRSGVIVRVNAATTRRALASLNTEGLRHWHDGVRIEDLTLRERRRLVKEILRAAGERVLRP